MDVCLPSAFLRIRDQRYPVNCKSIAFNHNFASLNKENGGLPLPKEPLGENKSVHTCTAISNRSRVLWDEIVNRWPDTQGLS